MMFLFAELTKEIVFVCTIFISFTLKITCEICFWYCHGNQKNRGHIYKWEINASTPLQILFPLYSHLHTHIFLQEEAFLLPFHSFLLFSFKNWNLLFIIFQVESGFYPKMLLELIYNLISLSPCNKLVAPLK